MICERCGAEYTGNSCLKCQWELNWEDAHEEEGQIKRMIGALDVITPLNLDTEKGTANFVGSKGEVYDTTLFSCTCKGYMIGARRKHALPCKHIYRLAFECGVMPKPTKEDLKTGACFRLTFDIDEETASPVGPIPRKSSKPLYMADRVISDLLSLWHDHDQSSGFASEKAERFLKEAPEILLRSISKDLSYFRNLRMDEVEDIAKTLIWLKKHQLYGD